MNAALNLYRRLDLLQAKLRFQVPVSAVVLVACAIGFGSLLATSYRLDAHRNALMTALLDPAQQPGHAASLRESGELFVGDRTYGGPQLAQRAGRILDAENQFRSPAALVEELLAAERPDWAPGWLLEQPGTTWLLGVVTTLWLVLIVWMRIALPFGLTASGTGAAMAVCWALGSEQATLACAGIGLLTFTFVLLTRMVLILFAPPIQVLAVAHTVVKEASRTRVSLVFIVLLLVALPLLPMWLDPDAPLRFRVQTFISRSLGLTYAVAACMTIFLSCATVAFEIRDRQIWQLMTKPLARLNYLAGKWLGVVSINLVILMVAGVSIFIFTQYLRTLPVAPGLEGQLDALAVRDEVLTARSGRGPDWDELGPEQVSRRVDELIERDPQLAAMKPVPMSLRRELGRQIQQNHLTGQRSIPPGAARTYQFSGLRAARGLQSTLSLRYRFHILRDDEHEQFPAAFMLNGNPAAIMRRNYIPTMSHVLPIGTNFIRDDGTMTVTIANLYQPRPDQRGFGALNFEQDGFELLYKVGSFEGNFFRAMLIMGIKLAFLSILGICCATFLSFPVACLFSFTVFLAASLGPFLAVAVQDYYPTADRSSIGQMIQWVFQTIVRLLAQVLVLAVGAFGEHRPTQSLVEGRVIAWSSVGTGFVRLGLLWSGVALGLGYLVMRKRQLAIYSGHG